MKKSKNKSQIKEKDLPTIKSTSNVVINLKEKNDDLNIELPGYEKNEYSIINTITNTSDCWNCCHSFDNVISKCSIPLKYENNVFSTIGSFCSYPCVARYIIDSKENVFDKLSLLNLYVNMKFNKYESIIPAPPRLYLSKFGGNMNIEEYRGNQDSLKLSVIEPIVSHLISYEKNLPINKKNIESNKTKYKLYRRNNKKTDNSIYSSMNLVSDNQGK
jgi:hypothetical protein